MKKPLARAPARLQRMLLLLQKYNFQLSYKSGSKMVLADVLPRASLKDADPEISDEELAAQIHMVYSNNELTGTNLKKKRKFKADDCMLSEFGEKIQNGWPSHSVHRGINPPPPPPQKQHPPLSCQVPLKFPNCPSPPF